MGLLQRKAPSLIHAATDDQAAGRIDTTALNAVLSGIARMAVMHELEGNSLTAQQILSCRERGPHSFLTSPVAPAPSRVPGAVM